MTSRQKIRHYLLANFADARRLTREELAFAVTLAEHHKKIKIYHNRYGILLSHEAMYTPGVREVFFLRETTPTFFAAPGGERRRLNMKLVINKCYGGFGVSIEALKLLIEMKSEAVETYTVKEYYGGNNPNFAHRDWQADYQKDQARFKDAGDGYRCDSFGSTLYKDDYVFSLKREDKYRSDPALVSVVEKLGKDASSDMAELKVVEVPDGIEFEIEEYDGVEWVSEVHRTWG
jgi:hypothetical protein